MKTYRLMNEVTGEFKTVEAMTVQQACEKAGWSSNQCYASEVSSKDQLMSKGVILDIE